MNIRDGHRHDLPVIGTDLPWEPLAFPGVVSIELPTACDRLFVSHGLSLRAGREGDLWIGRSTDVAEHVASANRSPIVMDIRDARRHPDGSTPRRHLLG